jgi:hypothetical protein
VLYPHAVALVPVLLRWCRPPAIARLVIPMRIGPPIHRVPRCRPRPHIHNEIVETRPPPVANRNPPPPIQPVIAILSIITPPLHRRPRPIPRRVPK